MEELPGLQEVSFQTEEVEVADHPVLEAEVEGPFQDLVVEEVEAARPS